MVPVSGASYRVLYSRYPMSSMLQDEYFATVASGLPWILSLMPYTRPTSLLGTIINASR
ncbi:hypothetical protein SERLA73DRAFT_185693 [Serpula lacrymans var. lacrymans S7.3]|uniref:Uncharacterized protein n=2 Tax=Serpula lacrymans var. lacrymans TaxID=341189 RepID=F8Q692_SERL3|nr:uncharacterized protein SERLADRAFT_474348 [Serpula lacrymans var. lacrymans S7.9]EGN96130.1 hypothetical protein SERLA73DRAFT_185693 [Serpula lacrymans var. lacrymans S7.3]EGO21666.1 hypothetical protein SERLADRAFT_474348 [Serpula lacrymans var. lacrymans S7.9]